MGIFPLQVLWHSSLRSVPWLFLLPPCFRWLKYIAHWVHAPLWCLLFLWGIYLKKITSYTILFFVCRMLVVTSLGYDVHVTSMNMDTNLHPLTSLTMQSSMVKNDTSTLKCNSICMVLTMWLELFLKIWIPYCMLITMWITPYNNVTCKYF